MLLGDYRDFSSMVILMIMFVGREFFYKVGYII